MNETDDERDARYLRRERETTFPELRGMIRLQLLRWRKLIEEEFMDDVDRRDDDGYHSWDSACGMLATLCRDIEREVGKEVLHD